MKAHWTYILLLLWLGCSPILKAQEEDKADSLLYAVDVNLNPDQPQYFIPTIENILKNLRYANPQRSKRFAYVENANRLKEDGNIYNYIKVIFEDYISSERNIRPSTSRDNLAGEITDFIKSYDEFLYIKINSGQLGFIEFQFYRYEILDDDSLSLQIDTLFVPGSREIVSVDRMIDLPVHKYKRSSSIFINLQDDSENQVAALRNAISQVFDETNQAPEVLIIGNGKMYNDTMFFALGDTIELRAEVFDPDSRKELFSYDWRQIAPEEIVPGFTLTNNQARERVVINTEGCYTVGVEVNDGIQDSEEEEIVFCLTRKPILILNSVAKEEAAIIAYQSYLLSGRKRFLLENYQLLDGIIECKDTSQLQLSIEIRPITQGQNSGSLTEQPQLQFGNRILNRRLPYNSLQYSVTDDFPYYVFKYLNPALNIYDRDSINYYFGGFYIIKDLIFDSDRTYDFYLYSQFSPNITPKPGFYDFQIRLKEKALQSDFVPFKVRVANILPLRLYYSVNFFEGVLDTLSNNGDTAQVISSLTVGSLSAGLDLKLIPQVGLAFGLNYFFNEEESNTPMIPYFRGYVNLNQIISFLPKRRIRKYIDPIRLHLFYEMGLDTKEFVAQNYVVKGFTVDADISLLSFRISIGSYRSSYFEGPFVSVGLSHAFYRANR